MALEFPRKIKLQATDSAGNKVTSELSTVERVALQRYGNPSKVRMEVRYGLDDSTFLLVKVMVDYLKTPQTIRLTQDLIDLTRDYSLVLEFPDYVCQEIINELVHLVMENAGDQRLLTHIPMTNTIANPALLAAGGSAGGGMVLP